VFHIKLNMNNYHCEYLVMSYYQLKVDAKVCKCIYYKKKSLFVSQECMKIKNESDIGRIVCV